MSATAPPAALDLARAEMAPGERLIWAERPQARAARRRALPRALFGAAFAGFGLFWTVQAWAASGWLALFGLPFVALGGALAAAPWWWPKRARNTVYAISDQRLLIIEGWPRRRVRSFGPGDIEALERRERPDGTGDLIFRRELAPATSPADARHDHWHRGFRTRAIGFFGIPEVARVEAAVRALQRGAAGALRG